MNQVTAEDITHTYYQDPEATPTEIIVGEHLRLSKGKEITDGENEGVITGFGYNADGSLETFYIVEVCWFKGPRSGKPETRLCTHHITELLHFLNVELIES